jgi:hypothetical protein
MPPMRPSLSLYRSLPQLTVPKPVATGRDLVVRVKSVSVNPVCLKKRSGSAGIGALPTGRGAVTRGLLEAAPTGLLYRGAPAVLAPWHDGRCRLCWSRMNWLVPSYSTRRPVAVLLPAASAE